MVLKRSFDGEDILGLKINGGVLMPSGRLGAIVDKVKRGSIADQEGQINAGNWISLFIGFIYFLNSLSVLNIQKSSLIFH